MITGQSPKITWRPNAGGQLRTIEEAVTIARKHGVQIPGDVEFFVDELELLGANVTARGPRVGKHAGEIVVWSDLLNIHGKVPFLIHPDVLNSDEAIVAVFAHEMHELGLLRPLLKAGGISIEECHAYTSPYNPGNYHDAAWEVADDLVERMRRTESR
jgi:hypothetical protein